MKLILIIALFFSVTLSAQMPETKFINVKWKFKYLNKFPGKIDIYEVHPIKLEDTGETKNIPLGQALPVLRRAPSNLLIRSPYGQVPLALVIENKTEKDWYFFANFHNFKPGKNTLGIKVSCLCNAHIFKVKAKSKWYRIISVRLTRRFIGKKVDVIHEIVGLTEEEIKIRNLRGTGVPFSE